MSASGLAGVQYSSGSFTTVIQYHHSVGGQPGETTWKVYSDRVGPKMDREINEWAATQDSGTLEKVFKGATYTFSIGPRGLNSDIVIGKLKEQIYQFENKDNKSK
jgi:hypothetical protein